MLCAASSITRSERRRAIAYTASRSNGSPAISTGISALVRGPIAASIFARSILRVAGSMSTNTGRAPARSITFAVATHDSGVVTTSSPGPMFASASAISSAPVPEVSARTGRPPKYSESRASNAFACGPVVIQPERSTSATPSIVSSSMLGRVKGR